MDRTAQALLQDGYTARTEARLSDARADYAEAVELCRRENNLPLLVQSLKRLGGIERDLGNINIALDHYREAASLLRTPSNALDDPLNLAHTVRHIADILREAGLPKEAAPHYKEALTIYRDHPEARILDIANTLRGVALLQSGFGRNAEAIATWKEAGELYARLHLQEGVDESQTQITRLSGLEL